MNRTAKYGFTIIVPIYNEEESLETLGDRLAAFLPACLKRACVLFVDDGSTDSSLEIVKRLCSANEDFSYISFARNAGLSAALCAGFKYCQSELCGYIDADLQTFPEDFNILLEHIGQYTMVTGVRTSRNDSVWRRMQSSFANSFRRLFTNDGVSDTCCPLKVFHTANVREFPVFNGMHRFFPALTVLQGGSCKEVPVSHGPRMSGKSKFGLRNRLAGPAADCLGYCWLRARKVSFEVKEDNI